MKRDAEHYLDLFADTETVGRQLLAKAICVARGESGRQAVADVARDLPETTLAKEARGRVILEGLEREEPPAWAVRALADEVGSQVDLAEECGVSDRAVRKWCNPDESAPSGSSARVLQIVANRENI